MLGNIKRKVPGSRKPTGSTPPPYPTTITGLESMQTQAEQIVQRQAELTTYAQYMRPESASVVDAFTMLQQTSDRQDETMRQLMQYVLRRKGAGTTT